MCVPKENKRDPGFVLEAAFTQVFAVMEIESAFSLLGFRIPISSTTLPLQLCILA